MKRLIVGLLAVGLFGQVPSVLFEMDVPPRVRDASITAQITGARGSQTYYYWVVARYPVGTAFPGGPAIVRQAPDTLAVGNFITVRWTLMPGAVSYDVLRTTTPQYPSGVANVLVAGAVAGPAQVDNTNVVGAYTLAATSKAAGFLRLDNRLYAQPEFVMQPGLNIIGNLSVSGAFTGGAFTPGSVLFANALGDIAEDNANLFWDDANNRVGIGTNAPVGPLDVTIAGAPYLTVTTTRRVGIGTAAPVQMLDVEHGHLEMGQTVAPAAAPNPALGAAGLLNGNYYYRVSYVTALGQTETGALSALIAPVNQQVNLTNIPVSADVAVTARNIYRTTAGGANTAMRLVATIADNVTTIYTDNIADGALGVFGSRVNTTGGVLYLNEVRRGIADNATTSWGVNALRVSTSHDSSAFGLNAGYSNTTGSGGSFFGQGAGYSNTTGEFNSFFGYNAGRSNTTGSNNAFFGRNTGFGLGGAYAASNNVFVGYQAGRGIQTGGNNNILIGYQAADNLTTGAGNIVIAYDTDTPAVNTANFLNLGNVVHANLANLDTGIGPLNIAPTGTLDVLDRTPATGATLMQVGTDGANTSVVSTSLTVRAGAAQGAVNLQGWLNAAGTAVGSVSPAGDATFRSFTETGSVIGIGSASYGGIALGTAQLLQFSSTVLATGAKDLGLYRSAAGLLEINSGTAGIANFRDTRMRDLETSDVSVLGTESLSFPADFSNAVWVLAGEFAVVGTDAVYTFAGGGAGTVTQAAAGYAVVAIGSRWYRLQYTVAAGSTVAGPAGFFTLTNAYALVALPLAATTGVKTYYFESAVAPGNFVFNVAGATGGTFTITDASLRQIQGGDVRARGMVELNAITFVDLPAAVNGSMVYCVDCTIASPCAAAGPGAVAKRMGAAWICN